MSHFAVAVLHGPDQDVEELLAPYSENITVAPYVVYTRDEAIEYARKNRTNMASATDEACYQEMVELYDGNVDGNGNIVSTYNPDSKWDWYQIGGRWSGMLKLKRNAKKHTVAADDMGDESVPDGVDEAPVSEIDFGPNERVYDYSLRWWDVIIDGQPQPENEKPFLQPLFKKEYYIGRYGNRETYAEIQAGFSTYAVITPDGQWHAPGEMGWFGCSTETDEAYVDWVRHYVDRFISNAEPDTIMTIVDCHI